MITSTITIVAPTTTAMWYSIIAKPSWAPPAWVFGPVWTVLYAILAVSFIWLFYLYGKKRLSFAVITPFIVNLAFNLAYSPIQFVFHQYVLGCIDIALILGTLVWMIAAAWKPVRWVAIANIPYLGWVAFATTLQFALTFLNLGR